jgi:hypothetical protein
MIYHHHE